MKKIISILMCVIVVAMSTNVFAQESGSEIKENIKRQKEASKYQMTDTIAVKFVNSDDCEEILRKALIGYEYTITKYHDTIKTYTLKFKSADDANKAVDILNKRDDIIYAQNDYYGGHGTIGTDSVKPVIEVTKNYELNILNQNAIIVGDPDGNLRENDEITRAEFAAVLCRAMGCENEAGTDELKYKNYFPDVTPEHWAAGYVNFAYESGAISGFPDGKFYPEQPITNEQVIKMLIAAWGYADEAEQNRGYPNGYMKVAKENGILDTIEFNYANASKRWVVSVFVYGVLSIESENEKVKQPIKTEQFLIGKKRPENDDYVERPEEILKKVTEASSAYERTVFEQQIPNDYLPMKIDGKTISNVWYRDFTISIHNYTVSEESYDYNLNVGESFNVSNLDIGEYDITIGYNDGKVNDYSFAKLVIDENAAYISGVMHRYTAFQNAVQFDEKIEEIELTNSVVNTEIPFDLKATSDGKGNYILCINYPGALTGKQELRYSINDNDETLNFKVDEGQTIKAPQSTVEPFVIHNLQENTEYCLQVSFYDEGIQKTIKGLVTVADNDFCFNGNWQIVKEIL